MARSGRVMIWFWVLSLLVAQGWAAPPALKVTGNQILTASEACTVRLRGVNVDSLEYVPNGNGPSSGGITATVAQSIQGWGSNCIRLPLSQDFWFGIPNAKSSMVNKESYRRLVDDIVQMCSDNNAYVILDLHWSGTATTASEPGETGWGVAVSQRTMPDANSVTFWKDVATRYANHPAVLFNLFNEPYNVSWTVWRNGGDSGSGYQTPGLQALLDTVRSTGAHNVVVVGGLDWAYDLSGVPTYHLTDSIGSGVVYDAHVYPWKGGAPWLPANGDTKISVAAGAYPVLIGEFGQNPSDKSSCANCTDPVHPTDTRTPTVIGYDGYSTGTWTKSVIDWINLHGYHYTAWDMHTSSSPCLIANWSFTPTTYHGLHVKADLATPVPISELGCVPGFTATETPTPTFTFTFTPTVTGTIPTNTFTVTRTPSNTPTVTMTPISTTCMSPFNRCETLGENGAWWGDNANQTLADASAAPLGAITEGEHCLKVSIQTGKPWNNLICNLSGASPKAWGDVSRVVVDVYVEDVLITTSGGWHQLGLMADIGSMAQTVIANPSVVNLESGANAITFNLVTNGLLQTGDITSLYLVYNSQNGGTGDLYIDNLKLVRGCQFTATPTEPESATPTPSPTETLTPTETPTGTWATSTYTPTLTATPGEGVGNEAVIFPNPVTFGTSIQISLGKKPQAVRATFYSVAFRRMLSVEGTTTLRQDDQGKAYWGWSVDLKDEAQRPFANGLYYALVETEEVRKTLKLLITR